MNFIQLPPLEELHFSCPVFAKSVAHGKYSVTLVQKAAELKTMKESKLFTIYYLTA